MLAFRKAVGILVSLIALAGLLVTVVLATRRIDQRPRTDDAYLQADLVHMAPDVSGRIVELDVRDNQAVRKGDVLFRIDSDPYRMRVDQARAAVRGLEAKLAGRGADLQGRGGRHREAQRIDPHHGVRARKGGPHAHSGSSAASRPGALPSAGSASGRWSAERLA